MIIEDDLELSPQWFSWLRRAWLTYGHRTDLAGVALSRQYMVVQVSQQYMVVQVSKQYIVVRVSQQYMVVRVSQQYGRL